MPQSELRIPFPLRGVSEAVSFQDQPPATCRSGINVRSIDPKTGRIRGAQRAGLSKFVTDQVGTGAIRNLASVVKANQNVTYEVLDGSGSGLNPTIEWSRQTPADDLVRSVATDRGGSVYAVSGGVNLVKYNADGERIWTTNVPVPSRNHYLRSVAVDEADFVYVTSYSDEANGKGRIWQYEQNDDKVTLVWTWEMQRGFAADLKVAYGILYYIENDLINDEAYLGVLNALYASEPVADWERPVPSPASQLVLDDTGGIFVCSLPNAARGDTDSTGCGTKTLDWNPTDDITPSDLHSWHRAEDLVELVDNDTVEFWTDFTGQGRGIFQSDPGADPLDNGNLGGLYVADALCGKPGVRFIPTWKNEGGRRLTTGLRAGNGSNNIIPGGNSQYMVAMLVRLRLQDDSVDGVPVDAATIEVQDGKPFLKIFKNNGSFVVQLDMTDPTPSAPSAPPYGSGTVINNELDAAIIIMALNPQSGASDSYYRINGEHVISFTCLDRRNSAGNKIGYTFYGASGGDFDLLERICITGDYGDPTTSATNNTIELIEGYLAHKYGVQSILDPSHPFKSSAPTTGTSTGSYNSGGASGDVDVFLSVDGIVAKFSEGNGALRWAYSGDGVGYGVGVDGEGGVWNVGLPVSGSGGSGGSGGSSIGSHPILSGDATDDGVGIAMGLPGAGDISVRRMADLGLDYSINSSDGAWTLALPDNLNTAPRLSVDEEKNLYYPAKDADSKPTLYKIQADGTIEWEMRIYDGTGGTSAIDGDPIGGLATALPQTRPDYGDDAIKEPEHLFIGCNHNDPGGARISLIKLGLVKGTQIEGSPREVIYLAVSEGNIRRLVPGASPDVTDPTDGAAALSATSSWIQAATAFQKVFYTDGETYRYYDAKDDAVKVWKATSAGTMPTRARLVASWNGSIVLARFADAPNNWHISKFGDPFDWDRFPAVQTLTDSVSGNDPGAGLCPAIINAIIPISDDLLIFGCEDAIYRMTGHPLQGGQFDRLSAETGMLYGTPWCRDAAGGVYFFGSSGGVYQFDGVSARSISDGAINKALREIDYNAYTVKMVWNQQDQGLHVFVVKHDQSAISGEGGGLKHWFWCQPTQSWWQDEFASETLDPTACLAIWGDAEDERVVLVGNHDGFVRRWDIDAVSDDGVAIDSRVTIGPIVPSLATRVRFMNARVVLDANQNGATLEAYDSDDPASLGVAKSVATLVAGRNRSAFSRFRGQSAWVKISNSNTSERWSLEQMVLDWAPAGRVR